MTTANMYKALYQTLKAGCLKNIPLQQANLPKPAADTWAVITNEGMSALDASDNKRARHYFRIWIYSKTDEETTLVAKADEVRNDIDEKLISATGTGRVRFTWLSTSPVFWAEEYECRATDLTFVTITTRI